MRVPRKCWQAIARDLKKRTCSGAWAENPNTGGRSFYKNHRFTEGARKEQARGVVLAPASGDVRYDVLSDAPA